MTMHVFKKIMLLSVSVVALMIATRVSALEAAQEQKEGKKVDFDSQIIVSSSAEAKSVEGEVTWIGKDKIAIVYERNIEQGTESEILLPFDKKELSVKNKKNLSEIKVGDRISVQYEEMTDEYKDGSKKSKPKALSVTFLKPAEKQGALVSDESLSLKGTK